MAVFIGKCQHGQVSIGCIECYRLALGDSQDKVKALELQNRELVDALKYAWDEGAFCAHGLDCDDPRHVAIAKLLNTSLKQERTTNLADTHRAGDDEDRHIEKRNSICLDTRSNEVRAAEAAEIVELSKNRKCECGTVPGPHDPSVCREIR